MHSYTIIAAATAALTAGLTRAQTYVGANNVFKVESPADTLSYVVHAPTNSSATNPPCIVYLSGKGGEFQDGTTLSLDRVVSYGGTGWLIDQYNNGSRGAAETLVTEQFFNIIPINPLSNGDNWTFSDIQPVVDDARSKYSFDFSRIYLTGYSMGARAVWPVLAMNTSYYTAATVMAGIPDNMNDVDDLANIPIQQYVGSRDYEKSSQVWQANATQAALQQAGNTMSSVVIMNATHEQMQQLPYTVDMFEWLLQYQKSGTFAPTVPASSSASGASSALSPSGSMASVRDATANAKSGAVATSASLSALLAVGFLAISSVYI